MVETIIIENNNPNMLPTIIAVVAAIYLVYSIISIRIKLSRKKRLEKVRKKIVDRHEEILGREREINAKNLNDDFTF